MIEKGPFINVTENLAKMKLSCVSKASIPQSSLHCNISLSFCSFLYNGVRFNRLKLSVSDIRLIVVRLS